jgi:hypothetical protein
VELDDRLRQQLNEDARRVRVGNAGEHLGAVRGAWSRRRRRRRAITGAATTAVLLLAGTVAVAAVRGNSDGASIRSITSVAPDGTDARADGEDATPTTDEAVPTSVAPAEPATSAAPEPAVAGPRELTSVAYAASTVTAPPADERTWLQWLLPWQDGFLAIGGRTSPQQLPTELPEEVSALFPPEVTELFAAAGGLPGTVEEATAMLSEAGLLDEVTDVISKHPEASAAIYSIPPVTETLAWFTTDGSTWDEVDLGLPDDVGQLAQLAIADGRLVGLSSSVQVGGLPAATVIHVVATDDLSNWRRWELDASVGVDEFSSAYGQSLATTDDGWLAVVGVQSGTNGEEYAAQTWWGSWDGEPVRRDDSADGFVLGTSTAVLDLASPPRISTDGSDWRPIGRLSSSEWVTSAWPVDDGFVLAVHDNDDGVTTTYRIDASGERWEPVVVPGAPDSVHSMYSPAGPAQVVASDPIRSSARGDDGELPDLWLMATEDGDRWLVHPLATMDSDGDWWWLAAINGDTAMMSSSEGWTRFELGE